MDKCCSSHLGEVIVLDTVGVSTWRDGQTTDEHAFWFVGYLRDTEPGVLNQVSRLQKCPGVVPQLRTPRPLPTR